MTKKKMVSFRIDTNLLDRLNKLGLSKTDVIHKALSMYLQKQGNVNTVVNTSYKESVNTSEENVNTNVNTPDKENVNTKKHNVNTNVNTKVNPKVNPEIQIIENYELLQYLKYDHEWLKSRIEHFEKTQDLILSKINDKHLDKEKTSSLSGFRM